MPLLHLLINCISARSSPKILSIKGYFTFLFSNFLIIGLCNSSANSLFNISLLLIPLPSLFVKKIINHWNNNLLMSIIFSILSNMTCFLTIFYQNLFFQLNLYNLHKPYPIEKKKLHLIHSDKYIGNFPLV